MKFISPAIAGKLARHILVAQKHAPRAMFATGLIGAVTSTVLACRATLKLEDVIDEIETDILTVRENNETPNHRQMAMVYAKSGFKIGKLYAPAIVIGGASIGALTGSHVTLSRRNAGLTAAYAGLSKGLDEYRDRVKAEIGEDKERDIYHGLKDVKVKGDDGKMITIKTVDPNTHTAYARFFDEYNRNWEKDPSLNRVFVQCQQAMLNNLLHARGHVFLNEAYEALGFEHSRAGALVGWVTGPNGKDQFIDFGIFEIQNANFVNGHERSILLDFNVDGPIWNLI